MAFTAKDVQALREKTGVGMMDCKKALVETDGDIDKAIDILREKGLASAAKKASRVAAEGVVAAYNDANAGALVEINCETDFVAKGAPFVELAAKVVKTVVAAKPADLEALLATKVVGSEMTVDEEVQEVFLALRENMKVRRFALIEGHTTSYIHAGGSVGVLAAFDVDDATAANDEFIAMSKNVAMQIAAMSPEYLSKADISEEEFAKMKSITIDSALNKPESLPVPILNSLTEEAISSKKWSDEDSEIFKGLDQKQKKNFPNFISKEAMATLAEIAISHKAEIVENKIFTGLVQGRLAKQVKEICLLEQTFVRSDLFEGDVNGYINSVAKAIGADIKLKSFVRFAKGEGIEKKVDDFAAEIASMVK
ncbi:MAG: elongation factor Ts [Clostridia bacterium]|nr:elongation factor Ts [Clostridia bacterium]